MKMQKQHISSEQLLLLMISAILSTSDILLPSIVAGQAGRDAWISVLLACLVSVVFIYLLIRAAAAFPGKDLNELAASAFGPFWGSMISLLYTAVFILLNAAVIRQMIETLINVFIPEESPIFFAFSVMLVISYVVYLGIECIARLNEIIFPYGILALLVVVLLAVPYMDFKAFLPVLENGPIPVLYGSFTIWGFLIEGVLVLFLLPYINKVRFTPAVTAVSIMSVAMGLLMGVLILAVFGVALTSKLLFSPIEMVRMIRLGQFYETLDIFIMLVWVGGIFIKAAVIHFCTVRCAASVIHSSKTRYFILPAALLTSAVAITDYKNIIFIIRYISNYSQIMAFLFLFLVPTVILTVSFLKKGHSRLKVQP